jgi:hypothetical protein
MNERIRPLVDIGVIGTYDSYDWFRVKWCSTKVCFRIVEGDVHMFSLPGGARGSLFQCYFKPHQIRMVFRKDTRILLGFDSEFDYDRNMS